MDYARKICVFFYVYGIYIYIFVICRTAAQPHTNIEAKSAAAAAEAPVQKK